MPVKIHDSGYKKLFSNHTIFRQLLETFIPQPWVKELDFNECETLDKSFVSDHYKETESDLIYRVKVAGEIIYIYILLEFQSTSPRFMAVRVLNYITSFYLDYVNVRRKTKNLKLPVVFPIVLYNGEHTWTAPVEMADLIEKIPALGEYGLHFKYLLLAENAYTPEKLLQIRNIVSTLFLAEAHYDVEILKDELLNLYEREIDKQAVSLLLNWFRQLALYGIMPLEDYAELDHVYRTKEEVHTMLATALERERQKNRREGYAEGHAEGHAEGERATQRKVVLQLLQWRFKLVETEQAKFTRTLAKIDNAQQLAGLLNSLLREALTIDEFVAQLMDYLSVDEPE